MAWLWEGADPFYGKYTPNNVFTDRAKSRLEVLGKPIPIKGEPKSDFGFQLHQLAELLRSHGLDVALRVVDDTPTPRRYVANWSRISPAKTTTSW